MSKKDKEKLQKETRKRHQNLSEEGKKGKIRLKTYKNLSEKEKGKKCHYRHDANKNLSEEEKQKKVEYMRNYYL